MAEPGYSTEYVDWLLTQPSPDASLRHMRISRLLGIAQRKYPRSRRAECLRAAVAKYYEDQANG